MKTGTVEEPAVLRMIISALISKCGVPTSGEEMKKLIRGLSEKTKLPLETVADSLMEPLRTAQKDVLDALIEMQTMPPSKHQ
jgi:hypothetical protein